jgi:ferredoxin
VRACPRNLIERLPTTITHYVACSSRDKGKAVKDVCRVGCIACNLCVKVCPAQALAMDKNLPVMDFERCIDCGICVHKCPTGSFIDRAPGRPQAVINSKCDGCQACVKACQFKAIEGEPDKQHKVVADKCIGCGECRKVCPVSAIDMVGALGHTGKAL